MKTVDWIIKEVEWHREIYGIPLDETIPVYIRDQAVFKKLLDETPLMELMTLACAYNWRPVHLVGELQLDLLAYYPELIFNAPYTTAL